MKSDDRYEILDKIGAGSFATVYRARDKTLGREVAIKQLHEEFLADPERLQRYWQEAQLLASLQHPNIVTIFDVVRERGWLVMELMQTSLADRLRGRQVDLRALRATLAHVLRALKYLHSQGIIHGDIKPGNLMIDARRRVKIGDFGLARRVSNEEGSLLKGTTKYMAPECVSEDFGEVGPASDLYSLGFCAYELMCGTHFDDLFPGLNAFGKNKQIAWMMWHAAPDRRLPEISRVLEGVPPDLAQVVQKLTEKDQAKRYRNADEALSDLKVDLKLVPSAGGESAAEATDTPGTSRRTWIAGGALAFSVVLSLAMLFWPSGKEDATGAQGQRTYAAVNRVEADANRLVVQDPETGALEEFTLGRKQKIFLTNEHRNVLLRDLVAGDRVELEHDAANPDQILSVTVDRPTLSHGTLRQVDVPQSLITVTLAEGALRDDLIVRVPASAQLKLNGDVTKLKDLEPGDTVELKHVGEPFGKKGRVLDALGGRRAATLVGFVRQYDPATNVLAVDAVRGAGGGTRSYPLAKMCHITFNGGPTVDGRTVTANDLRAADRVVLKHDIEIHSIAASRSEQLAGTVLEIDEAGGKLMVSMAGGQRHAFALAPNCEATLGLDKVSPSDLRRFDEVQVAYAERSDGNWEATQIDARRPPQTDRWAIVIAGENYTDSSITRVRTAHADARRIHSVLQRRYAVPEQRLVLLLDASKAALQERVSEVLQNASRQTQVLIFITVQAYRTKDGDVYLAPSDYRTSDPAATGVPWSWLTDQLQKSAATDKIVLWDCPPAGTMVDAESQRTGAALFPSGSFGGSVVILSCDQGQQSRLWPETQQGFFAKVLSEGIAGPADTDRDLHLSPREIFDYMRTNMTRLEDQSGGKQTPVLLEP